MIPVCEPLLIGNELDYVVKAMSSNWISSSGEYVTRFEEDFAKYIGTRYALTAVNGTAALHLACLALGLGSGDEVIIPDFTMISSAFAICYTGSKPVFVDAELESWNIDSSRIEEKITSRTKAIMPVHIYGQPCNMKAISELASKYNLRVLEDAAEVHGAMFEAKKCGSMGDISCFSFFANKVITSGEGGMIATNDKNLYDSCRYFKNLAFPLDGPRDYIHQDIGFNYRMTNLAAAIGLAQLEKIELYIAKRRKNAALYREFLKDIPGLKLQPESPGTFNVYWMNGIVVGDEFGPSRNRLRDELKTRGIDSRNFFFPMHRQPALAKYGCETKDLYPVSDYLSERGLYLPSGSGLTESQIEFICQQIRDIRK